jgi:alpha-tubulin suppressor-like RCC1 family protein
MHSSFTKVVDSGVTAIAAGRAHSLILKDDGSVWVAGDNYFFQLGIGGSYTDDKTSFTQVVSSGAVAVAAGLNYSFVLKNDETILATGDNNFGQLGGGPSQLFLPVIGVTDVTAIAAGAEHSLILKNDGSVWATGSGNRFGVGTSYTSFTQVNSGVTAIAAGYWHSLIIKNDGSVWATGSNTFGQLGTGNTNNYLTSFTKVVDSDTTAIAAGISNFSLILKSNGTILATGSNYVGQLGTGNTTNLTSFTQVVP